MINPPPKFFTRLLAWFSHRDFYEELQGDIEESYYSNAERYGVKKAQAKYRSEVILLLRPSVLKKLKSQTHYNNIAMFKTFTRLFIRSLFKNKAFSLIKISGLSLSLAIGLLLISLVQNLESFDSFHDNEKHIYRIDSKIKYTDYPLRTEASTTLGLVDRLTNDFPEVKSVAAFKSGFREVVEGEKDEISVSGLFANQEIFEVFSFELVSGSEDALSQTNSIVLTESTAIKLFNTTLAVGKILNFKSGLSLQVGGIMKDIPKNSHVHFDALMPINKLVAESSHESIYNNWDDRFTNYLYILAREDANLSSVESRLAEIGSVQYAEKDNMDIYYELEPLDKIALGGVDNNPIGFVFPTNNLTFIYLLVGIIFICAAFNYTNLTLAKSLGRTKEIGTRKVLGAKKGSIFSQYIFESVLMTLLSLVLAYLLFYLLKDDFLELIPTRGLIELNVTWQVVAISMMAAIILGLFGGYLPAFWFSKLRTLTILSNQFDNSIIKKQTLRKVLLSVQLLFSIIFINGALIVFGQYSYVKEKDLGYNPEFIFNINLQGEDYNLVKREISTIPEVLGVSQSTFVTNSGSAEAYYGYYNTPEDSAYIFTLGIDEDYLENHDYRFVSGSNFENGVITNRSIIVNETLLSTFGLPSANQAIGETMIYEGQPHTIIGVVEDFHYERLNYEIRPFAFRYTQLPSGYLNVKVSNTLARNELEVKLDEAWSGLFPNTPIQMTYYEDMLERSRLGILRMSKIINYIAGIAIFISILGLLGLVTCESEMRLKELTMRRILGANFNNLTLLISKGYLILLIISAGIAIPITNWYFEENLLARFAFRIEIGAEETAIGPAFLLLMIIGFLTLQVKSTIKKNALKALQKE